MKSSNPILSDNVLEQTYALTERPMSISGTMNKLLILSLIMIIGAAAVFYQFSLQHYDFVNMIMTAGIIVGFICAIIIAFKTDLTKYLAPVYAFSQGAVLSGISCFFEKVYPGIVIQAISMTLIAVFSMAMLFKIGAIKATEKFKAVIFIATLAIMIFYIVSFIMSFFGVLPPYFYSSSILSIVVNVVIAVIAALNLIIDFDFIERGVQTPLPSSFEWYGAFGLLVTILWLYIEILRLLSKLRDR